MAHWDEDTDTFHIERSQVVHETYKAIRTTVPGFERTAVFVPKSQIHEDSEVFARAHFGTLIVTGWFARKRGWLNKRSQDGKS